MAKATKTVEVLTSSPESSGKIMFDPAKPRCPECGGKLKVKRFLKISAKPMTEHDGVECASCNGSWFSVEGEEPKS